MSQFEPNSVASYQSAPMSAAPPTTFQSQGPGSLHPESMYSQPQAPVSSAQQGPSQGPSSQWGSQYQQAGHYGSAASMQNPAASGSSKWKSASRQSHASADSDSDSEISSSEDERESKAKGGKKTNSSSNKQCYLLSGLAFMLTMVIVYLILDKFYLQQRN